ncbi:unnamed protein product [Spodoptera exigua]|nr:unnamed protein product [Spodoptera exigua]
MGGDLLIIRAPEMNARNTLFIHLLCWNAEYGRDLVDTMLKSVFMHDAYVTYIALIKSVISCPGSEEDNDDLVPILEQHSDKLRSLYGDFYISELISRHPESERVIIVCEHSELAVGMMCLNTQINYESLEENFVLTPFGGLRKLVIGQKYTAPKVIESTCSLLHEPHYTDSSIKLKDPKDKSRSNPELTEELPLHQLHILDLFDDEDEEEFEFDIVNIDTDLLRVPEFIRYDAFGGPAENIMNLIDGPPEFNKEKKPEGSKRTMSSNSTSSFKVEPTRFQGEPNAFLLELFAMHPAYDQRYGFDMLEAAFELFPNRDYCVMCIPTNTASFPLLEHFTLVTPYGVRMKYINDSLYVAHVNSVRGKLSVRPFEASDLKPLKGILEYAPRKDNLIDLFKSSLASHVMQGFTLLSENQPMGAVVVGACPFALWVLELPLTSLPKVYVSNRIVVVGASRTGLAFLETLLMGPTSQYLTFSNVTLISEHGLPTVVDCLKAADICVPRDGRYSDRYLKSVPFYYYLDVMCAVMVKIDRKRKCIHLKDCGTKYYDELVLTCGQQFQHPDYLKESLGLVKEVAKGKPCDRMLLDNPNYRPETVPMPPKMPENVFLINSLFEANICLRKLMRMISDPKKYGEPLSKTNQVVVYGDCIEAYSCLAALLELGLQPELIVFVEPFPSNEEPAPIRVNCFNDETIDARVQSTVENLGISVLRKCHLAAWHQIGNRVESLELMAPLISISLRCFALFYYGLRAINLHAFKGKSSINESGLVYDGGLVVSPTFETNDPSIYGAGTCVRYSRRLYAGQSMHKNHYSEDVGEALARLFLLKLDPFMVGDPEKRETPADLLPRYSSCGLGWQPVMKFESPIVHYAIFPGPLYYLKLRSPGKEVPMAIQQCLPRQGHTLTTDKCGNYFRLHLNVLHVVDAVTCLSHKPFCPEILQQLYGKHEAFFNKLFIRFQKKEISDFYEFFTQPWMSALYQESFRDLVDNINEQDIGTLALQYNFTS